MMPSAPLNFYFANRTPIILSKTPHEFHLLHWLPNTQHTFREWGDRRCPVADQLLEDQIIVRREESDTQRMTKHFIKPVSGVALLLSSHASEVFNESSQEYQSSEEFNQSIRGRGTRVEERREETENYE